MKAMKKIALAAAVAMLGVAGTASAQSTERLAFSGGPDGGTFQFFSNAIAAYTSKLPGLDVSNMASAGSVENLRRVNSRDADFGIVYSGDLYLGTHGKLPQDATQYRNVHAVSYMFGAPAHLVVLDGPIKNVSDLAGKKVAVGPAGSGAASAAERYFRALGMWDKIDPQFIGYAQGASALGDKQIDALWVFAGAPNASVIQAASSNKVRLLQVAEAAEGTSLSVDHPYYATVTIPAGTYPGVDYDVVTIEDGALWVAGRHVGEGTLLKMLTSVYSETGLAHMRSASKAAEAMTVESALNGVVTPVHKGAQKFWTQNGLTLTDAQK